MRNLKRALSLALASVMLLGMMVTGAGAASTSFTDSDKIVNQEAAEVTSGLGIFEGYTDGSFGPENVVTRAEMAVIICKMLNGSDVDPGNFTGVKIFNDVPDWAEGYINYCHSMKIVVGVGEGKFDPQKPVTTVEAATMLLKALGYFIDDNAQLDANWKTTVTGKATYLTLYGDLVLKVDEGLTRDNVAELVFNTLLAQRVAYDDNRQLYVNNRNRDVVVTNGTKDWKNTLAENTFGMWIVDGVVTANSCTDDTLSETVNNAPRTNVMFHSADTIQGYVYDYPCEEYQGRAVNGGYPFEYTTGLDMIGHAARVYYKIEQNAPVVYAIVDRATKVATISYDKNNTDLANAANQAGFRRNTILNKSLDEYKLNYSWDVTVGSKVNLAPSKQPTHSLILISNSSDYTVDVVIALDQYLDTVRDVFTRNEETDYDMTTANGTRLEVPHDEFAKGDYVIVTDVGNEGKVLNFEKPTLVSANITKITGISDADGTVKAITADGTEYKGSPVWVHKRTNVELDNTTDFEAIKTIGEATLILDSNEADARCVGLAQPESVPNYVYAAQFGVRHENINSLNTKEKLSVLLYFPDGTSSSYLINTSVEKVGGKANLFYKYDPSSDTVLQSDKAKLNSFDSTPYVAGSKGYTKVPTTNGTKTLSITDTGLGVYEASVRADGTVVLMAVGGYGNEAGRAITAKGRLTKGLSTLVVTEAAAGLSGTNMVSGSSVTVADGTDNVRNFFYQTPKTVYYYVNGEYDKDLEVVPFVGHENNVSFTHGQKGDDNVDNEFIQIFTTRKQYAESAIELRREVAAMMVYGVEVNTNTDLYWYLEGNYHITDRNGVEVTSRAVGDELQVTFDVYKESDGEMFQHTINNKGKYYSMDEARSLVEGIETGLKKLSSDGLTSVASNSEPIKYKDGDLATLKNRTVVLNAVVQHMNGYSNIFTSLEEVGGITANTKVIDATGRDRVLFSSVADIEAHWRAKDKVTICYTYATNGSNAYKVNTIIVSGYEPGALEDDGYVPSTGSKLYMDYNENTGKLEIFDPENVSSDTFAAAAKAAYEKAGFSVSNVYTDAFGAKQWAMTITRNGMTRNVFYSGRYNQDETTLLMGTGKSLMGITYFPMTTNLAEVTLNGDHVGYYTTSSAAPVVSYTAGMGLVLGKGVHNASIDPDKDGSFTAPAIDTTATSANTDLHKTREYYEAVNFIDGDDVAMGSFTGSTVAYMGWLDADRNLQSLTADCYVSVGLPLSIYVKGATNDARVTLTIDDKTDEAKHYGNAKDVDLTYTVPTGAKKITVSTDTVYTLRTDAYTTITYRLDDDDADSTIRPNSSLSVTGSQTFKKLRYSASGANATFYAYNDSDLETAFDNVANVSDLASTVLGDADSGLTVTLSSNYTVCAGYAATIATGMTVDIVAADGTTSNSANDGDVLLVGTKLNIESAAATNNITLVEGTTEIPGQTKGISGQKAHVEGYVMPNREISLSEKAGTGTTFSLTTSSHVSAAWSTTDGQTGTIAAGATGAVPAGATVVLTDDGAGEIADKHYTKIGSEYYYATAAASGTITFTMGSDVVADDLTDKYYKITPSLTKGTLTKWDGTATLASTTPFYLKGGAAGGSIKINITAAGSQTTGAINVTAPTIANVTFAGITGSGTQLLASGADATEGVLNTPVGTINVTASYDVGRDIAVAYTIADA